MKKGKIMTGPPPKKKAEFGSIATRNHKNRQNSSAKRRGHYRLYLTRVIYLKTLRKFEKKKSASVENIWHIVHSL